MSLGVITITEENILTIKSDENILTIIIEPKQIYEFTVLIDALKEIGTFPITISVNKDRLQILELIEESKILMHINIVSEKFKYFNCNKDAIKIKMNVDDFYNLNFNIRCQSVKDNKFIIYINKNDFHDGNVSFKDIQCQKLDDQHIDYSNIRI